MESREREKRKVRGEAAPMRTSQFWVARVSHINQTSLCLSSVLFSPAIKVSIRMILLILVYNYSNIGKVGSLNCRASEAKAHSQYMFPQFSGVFGYSYQRET